MLQMSRLRMFVCAAWAAVLLSAPLIAEQAATQEAEQNLIDPAADRVLKQMSDYLANAESFSFDAHIQQDEVLPTGQKIQLHQNREVWVQRPNRIRASGAGDVDRRGVWFNAGKLAILDLDRGVYATLDVPDNIDAVLDHLAVEYGMVMPLADLLISDPYGSAMANTKFGFYVNENQVRGVPCHHLAFRQDGLDWQIWIDAGDRPVPRKLVITFTGFPGQPHWSAELSDWNFEPKLDDQTFTFTPPADAREVEAEVMLWGGNTPGKTESLTE